MSYTCIGMKQLFESREPNFRDSVNQKRYAPKPGYDHDNSEQIIPK